MIIIIILLNSITTLLISIDDNDSKVSNFQKIFTTKNASVIIALVSTSFVLLSWLMTGISLLIAFIIYIPLLSVIQGNLKEYCCHKIDKRIGEIINSKTQEKIKRIQKLEKAKIEAAKKLGVNPNQLKLDEKALGKNFDLEILPDPTIPKIDVDLNDVGLNDNYYNPPNNNNYNPSNNTNYYNQNNPNNYYNQPNNNNYYNQSNNNSQYNNNNLYNKTSRPYQGGAGSVVAYSEITDNYDRASNVGESESQIGSYGARSNIHTQQPKARQMSSPYNGPSRTPNSSSHYGSSPFNPSVNPPVPQRAPYNSTNNNSSGWRSPPQPPPTSITTPPRNHGWNSPPPPPAATFTTPPRNQGWNDEMSNSSSNYSSGSRPAYRRNNARPNQQQSYDTVSNASEEPLVTPKRAANPRVLHRK